MEKIQKIKSDVLIIGTGVAGLSLTLYLDDEISVNMITKSSPRDSSSYNAQGGIACVTASKDSFNQHIKDTLVAGDGLCNEKTVEKVVKEAPKRIKDLKRWGVRFTGGNSKPELGREGGHSKRRILHHSDHTGEEVENKLLDKVKQKRNVNIFSFHTAVNLIEKDGRCVGVYVLDNKTLKVKSFVSKVIVMATGGCGKVYLYTSNPDIATGDGAAMAHRAGLRIVNMEFIQFHPTCLYSSKEKSFLITEAMRGEGAILKNFNNEAFMKKYDKRADLAPRDIVARAIDKEMKKQGVKHLYLDIHSKRRPDFIKKRFPSIYKKLKTLGIDITEENIPVVPAAHYCCGGIEVDGFGFTNMEGLMAIGECSYTGLHGANRLASNSILEALVFAYEGAKKIPQLINRSLYTDIEPWKYTGSKLPGERVFIEQNWESIRRLMWNYVGVVRSNYRLKQAMKRLKVIEKDVDYHYWNFLITPGLIELRNLVEVARIIIKSALKRKESRGLHYNTDYPSKKESWRKNTYI
ncbi:MAG: L-aspartate oxidase [Elusimicrobiota bacterium]